MSGQLGLRRESTSGSFRGPAAAGGIVLIDTVLIDTVLTGVALIAFLGLLAVPVFAQEARGKGPPQLGLAGGGPGPGLELTQVGQRPGRAPSDWRRHPQYRPYQTAYPYYIAPWGWYVPQTHQYKSYPPPVALEPRLGLMYNYPYAWQMGLQMPYDSDPLYTYSLGPYQGIVRSPQSPEWLHEVAETGGISLLRRGKFKEAGRVLAEEFRQSDDPTPPLLLAEALFALGKYRHAQLVLRHALELDGAIAALPEDVAAHFPSADDYEGRVKALVEAKTAKLLTAYLLLFTRDPGAGLDRLVQMMDENPKDEVPGQLYRHFLGRVFGEPEPPPAEEKPEQKAPEKAGDDSA
jgi:hypothetical protein